MSELSEEGPGKQADGDGRMSAGAMAALVRLGGLELEGPPEASGTGEVARP